ncbi:MAG: hypothetical protein ACOCY6_03670, partial [Halodesulfurarchaeum sp.]
TSEERTGATSGETLAATDDENTLTRTITFALRPDEPGVVTAEMQFDIPDQVAEFKTAIPANATVDDSSGFEPSGDGNYSWDETTARPSVTLAYSVNRTGAYQRSLRTETQQHSRNQVTETEPGYTFVDTGDWAIASVPQASVWWSSYRNSPRVTFNGQTAVSGDGVAGSRMVFLGEHSSLTRDVDGQPITMVVPDAASLEPTATAVLDSIEAASPYLPEPSNSRNVVIAAPTNVDWGPYGLADRSDTWVRADEPLDTPRNVWLHEFVHLRQDFRAETDARWITEGMAEYYAAYLTLEQGRIDFTDFRDHLDRGTRSRYDDTVLSEPETWNSLGNYVKGALVYGTIDRQIRVDTDGAYTARYLFERMNGRTTRIDQSFLNAEIEELVAPGTASDLEGLVTTTQTPEMWSRSDHRAAFGTEPPEIVTTVETPFELTGPYRNQSVEAIPTLVPGEALSIPITVTNEGGETGTYDVQLTVNGTPVTNSSGTLENGQTESFALDHTFEDSGTVELAVGEESRTVTVREPATPVVSDLKVTPAEVEAGSPISVTVRIANPESWPAKGRINSSVDGSQIGTWSVQLDANETVERTTEVTVPDPGEYVVEAGSMTQRVTVVDAQATTDGVQTTTKTSLTTATEPGTTGTTTPGFTLLTPLVALLLVGGRFVR